ncbi:hypothetical protein HDU79_011016 [Rhizoclosmatium sp. JEL0117]|nr:hypothetical protein HDU79_011016 [Rhizoclosmatium sp. JEL0117]
MKRSISSMSGIPDKPFPPPPQHGFILRELIMTFFDDEIGGKTIVELCRAVDRAKDVEKKMMKLMSKLITYVQDKDLLWIVICDQSNALFTSNQSLYKVFPLGIINYISDRRGTNIKVIISASANNEGYPTEMKGWFTHDIISHKFDNDEFVPWCKHFKLTSGEEIHPTSDKAIDALYWTGSLKVVFSLDLF